MPIATVLDYTAGTVRVYEYPDTLDDLEFWLEDTHGHIMKDCHFIATDTLDLKITTDKIVSVIDSE